MAKDILGEAGLHFDELNKLRVLDPEVTQQTVELKEECKEFVDSEYHLGDTVPFIFEEYSTAVSVPHPYSWLQLLVLPEWTKEPGFESPCTCCLLLII